MNEKKSNFSASEPALGFIYQIRYGLFLMLSDEGTEDKGISLETLDDIVVEDVDTVNLLQTKYHVNRTANLTDRSPDFWKTMRVWCENIKEKRINAEKTVFTLITSSQCSENSIMSSIKNKNEEDKKEEDYRKSLENIAEKLEEIAQEKSNETNRKGYEAYIDLGLEAQVQLLKNMVILDGSMDFMDIEKKIERHFRLTTEPKKIPSLRERLEGWWFGECIAQLQAKTPATISFESVRQKINSIQEQLKRDSLPLDFVSPLEVTDEEALSYDQRVFIRQLKLIATGSKTLKNAISDYHRAFQQRAKWVREDLLNPHEEDRYEERLFDHWKTLFELMEDNLDKLTEEELISLGKSFYENHYLLNTPPIYIREQVKDRFMVRGSCQMLADKKRIGWHPDFKNRF